MGPQREEVGPERQHARNDEASVDDRTREQLASTNAGQHQDRRGRIHREGERQQDRNAVGAA